MALWEMLRSCEDADTAPANFLGERRNRSAHERRMYGMSDNMPSESETMAVTNKAHPGSRPEEIDEARRALVFSDPAGSGPDLYPRMFNLSPRFIYTSILRACDPAPPEYVTVPMVSPAFDDGDALRLELAVARWNSTWEAAQFRRRIFGETDLPPQIFRIADKGDVNVIFVPRTTSRYYEYAPLFHLLPARTAHRFGLPQLAAGQWPFAIRTVDFDEYLPADFSSRLSRAWASVVWRHLFPVSPLRGFSRDDPIRLLAHNLDFWLPPVTEVMEGVLRTFPLTEDDLDAKPVRLEDGSILPGAVMASPRTDGDIWAGEVQASEIITDVVQRADASGRLRAIIDAVRSNRLHDDFSDLWSREKEDFERRLYRKRSRVSVKFVELSDTIPVQGPETEVIGSIVHADFLALLNAKDREIVVLLTSGFTSLTEVALELGYANHSAVSKRLQRIRRQAEAFFNEVD